MPTKDKKAEPKLITHRSHLTSIEQMIDDFIERFPYKKDLVDFSSDEDREKFKNALLNLFSQFLCTLGMDLTKAAGKGIDEALSLMRDPDYYETVQRRRKGYKKRQAEYEEQQKTDAYMRAHFPTREELERDIKRVTENLDYHERNILNSRKRLEDLKAKFDVMLEQMPEDDSTGDDLIM